MILHDKKSILNQTNQPLGEEIADWQKCQTPPNTAMQGQYCRIEIFDSKTHGEDLFDAFAPNNQDWTYLPYGPFAAKEAFNLWLQDSCCSNDPLFHSIIDPKSGKAVGMASYLNIKAEMGTIEIGHIHYSSVMQQSPLGTEAMYLMMRRVFDELGYRRYEWKCNALNQKSMNAAKRYGFQPEGVFRQHAVYKGRNRDTAWFAIIDKDWAQIKHHFKQWLDKSNFNPDGTQKSKLKID